MSLRPRWKEDDCLPMILFPVGQQGEPVTRAAAATSAASAGLPAGQLTGEGVQPTPSPDDQTSAQPPTPIPEQAFRFTWLDLVQDSVNSWPYEGGSGHSVAQAPRSLLITS